MYMQDEDALYKDARKINRTWALLVDLHFFGKNVGNPVK